MQTFSFYRAFHKSNFVLPEFDCNGHVILSDFALKNLNCKYQIKCKQIYFNIFTMFMVMT